MAGDMAADMAADMAEAQLIAMMNNRPSGLGIVRFSLNIQLNNAPAANDPV